MREAVTRNMITIDTGLTLPDCVPIVFSNAPKRYAVVESKGFIKAQCCVDM